MAILAVTGRLFLQHGYGYCCSVSAAVSAEEQFHGFPPLSVLTLPTERECTISMDCWMGTRRRS